LLRGTPGREEIDMSVGRSGGIAMKKAQSIFALGLIVCALLACRTLGNLARQNLFEGSNMADAAAAFKQKVGGPIKAVSLEITSGAATLRVLEPPDRVNDYVYSGGSCSGPRPVPLNQLELGVPRQQQLFELDEIDLAATPQVIKAALERTKIEGGNVSKITINRDFGSGPRASNDTYIIKWTIEIAGPRESAEAFANAKGEIIGVDLSNTARANSQDYFSPQALEDAAREIKQEFGGQVFFSTLDISKRLMWFTAATSATSDDAHQYMFDVSGVNRQRPENIIGKDSLEREGYKYHEIYFTLDDIDFTRIFDIMKTAFAKSEYTHPIITTISFRRPSDFYHHVKPVQWEITVHEEGNVMGVGRFIIFDTKGNFLDKH
jgi:hypothetical protein